jgi:hypothetical protein
MTAHSEITVASNTEAREEALLAAAMRAASWVLAAVPFGVAAWCVSGFSLVMPLFDHWTLFPIFARFSSGDFRWSDFFLPHNRLHVAPLVKLVLAVLATVTGWSFRAEMALGLLVVAYTGVILHRAFSASLPGPSHRAARGVALFLTMALLYSPAQDWIWTWSIGFFHYFENAAVATAVYAFAKRKPSIGLAVLGCVAATFNRFEGMFTWIVFLPALFVAARRLPRPRRQSLPWLAWGAAAAVSCGTCATLIAVARPVEFSSMGGSMTSGMVDRLKAATSLLGMSAGLFTESHGADALRAAAFFPAGVVVVALFVGAAVALLRDGAHDASRDGSRERALPWICLGAFAVAFAAATAAAREEVATPDSLWLLRCYLSAYSSTASLFAVATVHLVVLFLAERPARFGVSAERLGRVAAALSLVVVAFDYAHAFPRLAARRAEGHWDRYCVELAPYFAAKSTCYMPPGGGAALERAGFGRMARRVAYAGEGAHFGTVETAFTAAEPLGGAGIAAISGHVALRDDADGTVLVAFGDDRAFVAEARELRATPNGTEWIATLPWGFVESDPRPLSAWAYDRAHRVFRRLDGEARPRRQ